MENINVNVNTKRILSNKTELSRKSHLKLLEKNGKTLDDFLENGNQKINTLHDHHGELLKPGYKAQIAITIKSERPLSDVSAKVYRRAERADRTQRVNRTVSSEFNKQMKHVLELAAQYLGNVYISREIDPPIYEVCLMILFVFSVDKLSVFTLRNLRIKHFEQIRKSQVVHLFSKKKGEYVAIAQNRVLDALMDLVETQRSWYIEALVPQLFSDNTRRDRLQNRFVFVYSESNMEKTLRKFVARTDTTIPVIGFATFSKLYLAFEEGRNNLELVKVLTQYKSNVEPRFRSESSNNNSNSLLKGNFNSNGYVPAGFDYDPTLDASVTQTRTLNYQEKI